MLVRFYEVMFEANDFFYSVEGYKNTEHGEIGTLYIKLRSGDNLTIEVPDRTSEQLNDEFFELLSAAGLKPINDLLINEKKDTFGFETALKYLKEEKKVRRGSHENEKNYARDKFGFPSLKINYIYLAHNKHCFRANVLYMGSIKDDYDYNAAHSTYLLSIEDILSTDWYLVEE